MSFINEFVNFVASKEAFRFFFRKKFLNKGAFNNYVDQILTNFDPLPPSSGQAWTFYIPPPLSTWTKGGQKPPPLELKKIISF